MPLFEPQILRLGKHTRREALGHARRRCHTPLLARVIKGYLAHNKQPPPTEDHHWALDMSLLYGPREGLFLMSEVPLYTSSQLANHRL